MYLKFQAPVPGAQPNIAAGGLATMEMPGGFRYGVIYAKCTISKVAGGAGIYSLPLLTDIIDPARPVQIKIGGNIQRQRLGTELIQMNLLQSIKAAGRVDYYQGAGVPDIAAPTATVYNCLNSAVPAALAANTATTAVFRVPMYLIEYWRKNLLIAESLAWPTILGDGSSLPTLTVEIPITPQANQNTFSGQAVQYLIDYDSVVPAATGTINGVTAQFSTGANGTAKPFIVRHERTTQQYAAAGDLTIVGLNKRDQVLQFSLLVAAGDVISRVQVRKNGLTIRDVTKSQNDQILADHEMNVGDNSSDPGNLPNRFDIVFDVNDDPASGLPLTQNDVFEVIATLSTVQAANTMVILSEVYGRPV